MPRGLLLVRPRILAIAAGALILIPGVLMRVASQPLLDHLPVLGAVLTLLVFLIPGCFVMGRFVEFGSGRTAIATKLAYVVVLAPIAAALVAVGTFSPFLYYQF